MMGWIPIRAIALAMVLMAPSRAYAADPVLTIVAGEMTRSFPRDELLSRPDIVTITIPRDVSYGTAMTYRAVPLTNLLAGLTMPPDGALQAEAENGYVAHLPVSSVLARDPAGAIAHVAIEPRDAPWPPLPGMPYSAGPFYVVWLGASAAAIHDESWPWQVVRLSVEAEPVRRWPALSVDPTLPTDAPARAGQSLFIATCLVCHPLNRAGAAMIGPDLNVPMNPTEYFTAAGLRALIRNSPALRSWPSQQMPAFSEQDLSDQDIDSIVEYLRHMAGRKAAAPDRDAATDR